MTLAHGGQRALEACFLALLFACSAALSFHHGHVGFMPLDQSIVFDGGWRVLSGQLPQRDFYTPNGVVPILLQALFFKALGVSWSAYCMHAAVFNGLFALVSYAFLRTLDAPRPLAGFYSALSAVVFYPPFGVPYMEQHACFFSLLALLCAVRAVARGGHGALAMWGLVGPLILLASLCKQLPSLCATALLFFVWARYEKRRGPASAAALAGGVAALGLLMTAAWVAGIEPLAALKDWAISPGSAAQDRLSSRFLPEIASWNLARFSSTWPYAACLAIPLGSVLALGAASLTRQRDGVNGFAFPAALALGLFAMNFVFAWFTENAPQNSLAYLFVSLGALHVAANRLAGRIPLTRNRTQRQTLLRVTHLVLIALAVTDAIRFEQRVNQTRVVHDIHVTAAAREIEATGGELPAALAGLAWITPEHNRSTAKEFGQLVRYLERRGGAFFLIGDSSILYGVTGQPSLNPALWFHPKLTLPEPGTPELAVYEAELIERLETQRVRSIVVEGERTWMGVRAIHLPRLSELARERASGHLRFGPYRVLELDPPLGVSLSR